MQTQSFLSRKLGQFGFKVLMYLNKPHIIISNVFGVYDSPLVFLVSATNLEKVLLNNFLSCDRSIWGPLDSYFFPFIKFFYCPIGSFFGIWNCDTPRHCG